MTNTQQQLDALARGLRWLYDTEQPDGAIQHHLGVQIQADGNRHYGFVPSAWDDRVVITIDVSHVEWAGDGNDQRPANPLEPDELQSLAEVLTVTFGAEVVHTWNGHPATTGSLALKGPAHPTLIAAVNRYRAGCPEHPRESVFCKCGWYGLGATRLVQPAPAEPAASAE